LAGRAAEGKRPENGKASRTQHVGGASGVGTVTRGSLGGAVRIWGGRDQGSASPRNLRRQCAAPSQWLPQDAKKMCRTGGKEGRRRGGDGSAGCRGEEEKKRGKQNGKKQRKKKSTATATCERVVAASAWRNRGEARRCSGRAQQATTRDCSRTHTPRQQRRRRRKRRGRGPGRWCVRWPRQHPRRARPPSGVARLARGLARNGQRRPVPAGRTRSWTGEAGERAAPVAGLAANEAAPGCGWRPSKVQNHPEPSSRQGKKQLVGGAPRRGRRAPCPPKRLHEVKARRGTFAIL